LFLSKELSSEEEAFVRWVAMTGKSYGTKEEFTFRFEQFKKTQAKIADYNANSANNSSTVGLNDFADFTDAEWKRMLGLKP